MNRAALAPAALWAMIKESVSAWDDDFASSMGAAIAYYTAFSIAPLLIIVIAIAGFFFGREAASGYLYTQLAGILGSDGAQAIQGMVRSASDTGDGVIATVIGIVLLGVGATTVFAELQTDLDRIWKAPAVKKAEGIWALLRSRLLSFGLVISIGFVMLVSFMVSAMLSALGDWWSGFFAGFVWLLQLVNFVVGFAVVTVLFALMYKILPRVHIRWRDVWIGSVVTALLFSVGKFLVGLYVGRTSVASGFGAAGSLAVLLLWVYYSAQIFLLGAEFTWVYAHRYGSRQGKDKPATAKESIATTEHPQGERPPPADCPPVGPGVTDTLAPTPRERGVAAFALRHMAATTGVAVVLGAMLGRVARRRR